jgi:hypothetical protein
MIPSVADVIRLRWVVTACVRLVSVVLGLLALVPTISWLDEGLSDGDLLEFYYYSDRITLAFVLGLAGFIGLVFAGPLVRLVMPIPTRMRCLKCGYALTGTKERRCPECGLDVSSMLLGAERGWALDVDVWRELAVIRVIVFFRVVGVLVALFSLGWLLWNVSAWWDVLERMDIEGLLLPGGPLLGGLGLIVLARWMAERIVPAPARMGEAKPPPLPSQSASGGEHGGDDDSDAPNTIRPAGGRPGDER